MSPFGRATRRRATRYRPGRWFVAVLVLASAVIAVVAFRNATSQAPPPTSLDFEENQEVDARLLRASLAELNGNGNAHHPSRAVYRHSVVPGGVLNRGELRDAARRDPVVAAHYSNLSFDAARPRIVTERRLRYMSYRIGSRIYWTRRPVALREGETILEAGVAHVRARCGNLISEEPRTPTYNNEPPPAMFDEIEPNAPVNGPEPVTSNEGPGMPGTHPGGWPLTPGAGGPFITAPPLAGGPALTAPPAGGALAQPLFFLGRVPLGTTSPIVPSQPGQDPTIPVPISDGFSPGGDSGGPGLRPLVVVPSGPEPPASPLTPTPSERPVDPIQVPEPGTLLLISAGGAVAAARRWWAHGR